jgi:hypothetical protein
MAAIHQVNFFGLEIAGKYIRFHEEASDVDSGRKE